MLSSCHCVKFMVSSISCFNLWEFSARKAVSKWGALEFSTHFYRCFQMCMLKVASSSNKRKKEMIPAFIETDSIQYSSEKYHLYLVSQR